MSTNNFHNSVIIQYLTAYLITYIHVTVVVPLLQESTWLDWIHMVSFVKASFPPAVLYVWAEDHIIQLFKKKNKKQKQ